MSLLWMKTENCEGSFLNCSKNNLSAHKRSYWNSKVSQCTSLLNKLLLRWKSLIAIDLKHQQLKSAMFLKVLMELQSESIFQIFQLIETKWSDRKFLQKNYRKKNSSDRVHSISQQIPNLILSIRHCSKHEEKVWRKANLTIH